MNNLEKTVVQAALAMTRIGHEPVVAEINALRDAAWKLTVGCSGCNYDRHLCPGCDASIGHGDSDCGQGCTDGPVPSERNLWPEEKSLIRAALKEHGGCAPETCGGSRLDPCALGAAIERVMDIVQARDLCYCRPELLEYCASSNCQGGGAQVPKSELYVWAPGTWADVRIGDTVKLPGMAEKDALEVAAVLGVRGFIKPGSPERRPIAANWSAVRVSLAGRNGALDMNPADPVEIRLIAGELEAINALGGLSARVGTAEATEIDAQV